MTVRDWLSVAAPTLLDPNKQVLGSPDSNEFEVRLAAPDLGQCWRHGGWHRERKLVGRALEAAGVVPSRLARFADCARHAWVLRSDADYRSVKLAVAKCGDRFCVPCNQDRGHVAASNLLAALADRPHRLVTLTKRHVDDPLRTQLDSLVADFRKLRSTRWWHCNVLGGVAFIETTLSKSTGRWHPHLHLICTGNYIRNDEIAPLWSRVTNGSHVVDVRLIRDHAEVAGYVLGYVRKPLKSHLLHDHDKLVELVQAYAGRRTVITFGTWHGLKLWKTEPQEGWTYLCSLWDFVAQCQAGDPTRLAQLPSLVASGGHRHSLPSEIKALLRSGP